MRYLRMRFVKYEVARIANLFRSGYIVDRRQDYVWFLGLPIAALVLHLFLASIARCCACCYRRYGDRAHLCDWLRVYDP